MNARVVWASGAGGTWLRTTDGGTKWKAAVVPGAEDKDFRGIRALDANTAWLMSSGTGAKSAIYGTTDAGAHWRLLFTNPDAGGFFDAMAFWDAQNGMVAGDPVDGKMAVFTTHDGGEHWARQVTPAALPEEAAFAASDSSVFLRGRREAWLGTGGRGAGRVLHSRDGGATWTVAAAPIRNDSSSAGIFSLAFSDGRHGLAVGGDYAKDSEAGRNLVVTRDGGKTWETPDLPGPQGFRSAVVWLAGSKRWIVAGTSGSDVSADNGRTWRSFATGSYNALGIADGAVWAVGAKGRIARLGPL